jgi:hypothetical protein
VFRILRRRSGDPIVVVTLRYSVLLSGKSSHSWHVGRTEDPESYRAQLFDDARLSLHHRLFETVTLPSLLAQSPKLDARDFRLYVVTSDALPDHHKAALHRTVRDMDWIKVVEIPALAPAIPHRALVAEFLQSRGAKGSLHAHARLDDDDAVSADFFDTLRGYIRPEHEGWGLSRGWGIMGLHDGTRFTAFEMRRSPNISVGLAQVGGTAVADVHALGNHTSIDRKAPVIVDSRKLGFIRTIHGQSDTQAAMLGGRPANPEQVKAAFPFLKTAFW